MMWENLLHPLIPNRWRSRLEQKGLKRDQNDVLRLTPRIQLFPRNYPIRENDENLRSCSFSIVRFLFLVVVPISDDNVLVVRYEGRSWKTPSLWLGNFNGSLYRQKKLQLTVGSLYDPELLVKKIRNSNNDELAYFLGEYRTDDLI